MSDLKNVALAISTACNIKFQMRKYCLSSERSRRNLLIIIDYIKYLGGQGIALRGNNDKKGNFYQLLLVDSKKKSGIL